MRLSLIVPALTAAWLLTRQKKYADHAGKHLRAWFVDAATRMNPNLEYAQAIFGVNKGRGIGIIDTLHLVEVARAATLLTEASALSGSTEVRSWFAQYLDWMRTSKNGQEERDANNNHGTCWVLQAGEFARFTGNDEVMDVVPRPLPHHPGPQPDRSRRQSPAGIGANQTLQLLPLQYGRALRRRTKPVHRK